MAEEEAERESNTREVIVALRKRFQELITALKESSESPVDASSSFCQEFCQVLVEHGSRWKTEEDRLPLLEMYTVAILSYAEATPSLSPECEQSSLVLEKLGLNCMELLLSQSEMIPSALWERFRSSVKVAHGILQGSGNSQLQPLSAVAAESGIWTNSTLNSILSNELPETEKINEYLASEGPALIDMRIKHLIKQNEVEKAARLAKVCTEFPEFSGKRNFKQAYLVCLCATSSEEHLKKEIAEVDCKDALDMICNLESDGNEKGAFSMCSAFLKRQLVQGDVYCAWELTLLWSKLLMRLESSQAFLDQCRALVVQATSVYHILLLIKVIQSEVENAGLPLCIEMCIQALKMGDGSDGEDSQATICKTISCLMPTDLEVKRACQLTEFLQKPTVDAYYAVEALYNEPDQKLEEEESSSSSSSSLPIPIPNSLRCDLLLALKTRWPFDPEFWDWKTLKRNCLTLMGDEASIVSSIDELNDNDNDDEAEGKEDTESGHSFMDMVMSPSVVDPNDLIAERKKKREIKKLREQGFVSARFRNWQAYMQYCVLCDKEFLGHRIVKHALKHVQDGLFRCPICAQSFETRQVLEPHVAQHVKQSSKERLAAMNVTNKKLPKSPTKSPIKDYILKKSPKIKVNPEEKLQQAESNTPNSSPIKVTSPKQDNQRVACVAENTEDCSCPVTSCQKVFKYFRNLVAHMRVHKDDEEAKCFLETHCQKTICQYCRRQFVNMTHLNDHLKMHSGEKPYYCIQLNCKAAFSSHAELLMHRKLHTRFEAQCVFPDCGRLFTETYQLYDHEAQHYIMFTCKVTTCGKIFYSQALLTAHLKEHVKQEMSSTFISEEVEPNVTQGPENSPSKPEDEATVESASVKIKHSVESMLNENSAAAVAVEVSAAPPTTDVASAPSVTEPEAPAAVVPAVQPSKPAAPQELNLKGPLPLTQPCSVQLKPIPITSLEAVGCSRSELQPPTIIQDKKLFSCPKGESFMAEIKREQTLGSSVPTQSRTSPSDDKLTHVCPFEACTRRYSTSKSLARHVKKVHSEAFEEWKLSNRYKRLARMSVRKQLHLNMQRSPTKQGRRMSTTGLASPRKNASISQSPYSAQSDAVLSPSSFSPNSISNSSMPFYSSFCSQSENSFCDTLQNPDGLIHSDISQLWNSPTANGFSCDYTQQSGWKPKVEPDDFPDFPDFSFPSEMERAPVAQVICDTTVPHTTVPSDNGNMPPVMRQDSSVMTQASKYISSSLMVLHSPDSGQQCDIPQPDRNVGHMLQPMQSHHDGNVSSGQSLHSYSSHMPAQLHTPSVETLGTSNKSMTFDPPHDPYVSNSEVNNIANLNSTPYKNHTNDLTTTLQSSAEVLNCSNNSYFSNTRETSSNSQLHDMDYNVTTLQSATSADSKDKKETSTDEVKKQKKVRSSKRTKWPAIIKDGKVICRRCYREFSSTKSLGGHLSKRSQCKPFDEVDLNADLPTSFLDFLNDPDVLTVYQPSATPTPTPTIKTEGGYNGKPDGSCMYNQTTESNYLQNGSYPEIYESTYNMSYPKQEPGIAPSSCMADSVQPTSIGQSRSVPTAAESHPLPVNTGQSRNSEVNADSRPMQTRSTTLKDSVAKTMDVTTTNNKEDFKMLEIQKALQRLALNDAALQDSLKANENSSLNASKTADPAKERPNETVLPRTPIKEVDLNANKPFVCEKDGCSYGAMTKEALFKHLYKSHDYTDDMINELKKYPDKFCPYSCHICAKNFTRTTGLRIHYMNVHRLAKDEIPKIKANKGFRILKASTLGNISLAYKSVNCVDSQCNGLKVEKQELVQTKTEHFSQSASQSPEKLHCLGVTRQGSQDAASSTVHSSVASSVHSPTQPSTAGPLQPVSSNERTTEGHVTIDPQTSTKTHKVPDCKDMKIIKAEAGSPQHPESNMDSTNVRSPTSIHSPASIHSPERKIGTANVRSPARVYSPERKIGTVHVHVRSPTSIHSPARVCSPERKMDAASMSDVSCSFRPYRCVHKGCSAAFSVAHNLTLHYRAVHQIEHVADRGAASSVATSSDCADSTLKVTELECQVENCLKVFPKPTALFRHYLFYHRFTVQKSNTLLTGVDVGTFPCDQNKCPASFTSFLKYIDHVKDDHKAIKLSEGGDGSSAKVDLSFKCDCEGCDRSYTTKSNLLRHLMKKHEEVYEEIIKTKSTMNDLTDKKMKQGLSPNNGKENMVNSKLKMKKKNSKKKGKVSLNHWTSFGKPSLKSMDEASAMCTRRFSLQYPCMIKGCDSVSSAERNIFKHYATHGLTERYIEDQRSQFIFCKKCPRSRNIDSDGTSTESSEDEESDNDESSGELADSTLESSSLAGSPDTMSPEKRLIESENDQTTPDEMEKCKTGCPPSEVHTAENAIKGLEPNTNEKQTDDMADSEEMLLSLLEDSTDSLKRKAVESSKTETPPKKQRTLQQQSPIIMDETLNDYDYITSSENLVNFRNPLNIKSVNNVKIVMDKAFSNGADLLLKQLQDMRPMVILKKWLYS
ncbi:zinc finger protein 292a [Engraulis encrasicolus]|uniref:zinc finger protein 292a n=1 Tax=Engraulis encrasicolus TaxID=184585 RepID=UPI002FD6F62A